jgi:hypothetical protein
MTLRRRKTHDATRLLLADDPQENDPDHDAAVPASFSASRTAPSVSE